MARIRTVKPELFSHEELFDAERETGLPLRLVFIGLFTCCDREGRFKWRPRTLKKDVMPHDDVDFARVLDALATRGFVVKYTIGTDEYGVIPTWHKHQVINNRESKSEIPPPPENAEAIGAVTRASRVDDASTTRLVHAQGEGKGREGKGREEEGSSSAGAAGDQSPPNSAVAVRQDDDPVKREVWNTAKALCNAAKLADSTARGAIGKLVGEFGLEAMLEAVRAGDKEKPLDPIAYLRATCQRVAGQRRAPNKQEKLENQNKAIADELAAEMGLTGA